MPLLKAIAKATTNGVHACRDVLWMEWVLDAKCPEEECRWQRWYPDPVSGALLSLAPAIICYPWSEMKTQSRPRNIYGHASPPFSIYYL